MPIIHGNGFAAKSSINLSRGFWAVDSKGIRQTTVSSLLLLAAIGCYGPLNAVPPAAAPKTKTNHQQAATSAAAHPTEPAKKTDKEECQEKWRQWLARYGGTTPFASHRIARPRFAASAKDVQKILKGEPPILDYQTPVTMMGKEVDLTVGFGKGREFKDKRFLLMRDHLKFIEATQTKNELTIVVGGTLHMVDFFLNEPKANVVYVTPHADENTKSWNADYLTYQLNDLRQHIKLVPELLKEESADARLAYLQRAKDKAIHRRDVGRNNSFLLTDLGQLEELKSQVDGGRKYAFESIWGTEVKDSKPNVLCVLDTHGINEVDWLRELPSEACFKDLGYSSIRLVNEGVALGNYTKKEFLKYFRGMLQDELDKNDLFFAESSRDIKEDIVENPEIKKEAEACLKKIENARKAIRQSNKDLKPLIWPMQEYLVDTFANYSDDNLKVRFNGLEIETPEKEKALGAWTHANAALNSTASKLSEEELKATRKNAERLLK